MKNIMGFLAEYYIVGICVSILIVVGIYILVSINILRWCRKNCFDVGVSAFIPIVGILQYARYRVKISKTKPLGENEEFKL